MGYAMKSMKSRFRSLAEEYVSEFIKLFADPDGGSPEYWWVGGDVGGCLFVNDYFFSFEEVRLCVDNGWGIDEILEWYDYVNTLISIDEGFPMPNLKSWMSGCPRIPEDELEGILERKREYDGLVAKLRDDIRSLADKYTECMLNKKQANI